MTISIELHRRWDARVYQTGEITPRDSHCFVLEWKAEPQPVDAEVPAIIAQAIGRALTGLGRVGFRWSGATTWPEREAVIIPPPDRSVARKISDQLTTSWPSTVVMTAVAAVAAQLFQHDWDQQGQLALVLDPAGGSEAPAVDALQRRRDWRDFALRPPVIALIAPIVDGTGALFATGSNSAAEQLLAKLTQGLSDAGLRIGS
jgi:hypothetical protein